MHLSSYDNKCCVSVKWFQLRSLQVLGQTAFQIRKSKHTIVWSASLKSQETSMYRCMILLSWFHKLIFLARFLCKYTAVYLFFITFSSTFILNNGWWCITTKICWFVFLRTFPVSDRQYLSWCLSSVSPVVPSLLLSVLYHVASNESAFSVKGK